MNYITHKNKKKKIFNNINATANQFNDYFLTINGTYNQTPQNNEPDYDSIEQFCNEKLTASHSCSIPHITVFEVGKAISNLSTKKSTGADSINPFFLKLSLPYIVESLTFIYNLCIDSRTFPTAWKTAKVIPIPKTKNASDLSSYRPISLLSVLSKPLERHIHSTLYTYMEDNHLFHDLQSGFRKGHSCSTALTYMCDRWLSAINDSLLCGAIFLDFQKAFDLVDHDILVRKIHIYTRNSDTSDLISSFLCNRFQFVTFNGQTSRHGAITSGVPQGSILGPLLFCMFINDLPLKQSTSNTNCHLFADDGTLTTSGKTITELNDSLQKEIDNVVDWSKSNKMILHPEKTTCMVIAPRQKHQISSLKLDLYVNNNKIQQVDSHKVLGVIIDDELRWDKHIIHVCNKVSRNLYLLFKLTPYIDPDNMKKFFLAHCLSHFNFCSNVWSKAAQCYIKKANSLHRRAANLLLPSDTISTDEKLQKLELLPLNKQFMYNTLITTYKAHTGLSPSYLSNLLIPSDRSERYIMPNTRLDLYMTSYSFQASSLWNSLPIHLRLAPSLKSFASNLKKHFLDNK